MTEPTEVEGGSVANSQSTAAEAESSPRARITGAFARGFAATRVRGRYVRLRIASSLTALLRSPRRAGLIAITLLPLALSTLPAVWVAHRIFFNRTGLPDLETFIQFEPPTTGVVRDARGDVLIELARQYREIVTYDEVPPIVRQAILAAEDRRFFSHPGVDYMVLPRVIQKTAVRSVSEWKDGNGFRLLLPQGGSTLTQQLVRGYFLRDMTSRTDEDFRFSAGFTSTHLISRILGPSAANKLQRKLEEVRLTLWLEREMRKKYGTKERAKQEIFSRYASFIYLGNGRYGFAEASEYYFGKPLSSYALRDAGSAAVLAGIAKSPEAYAPKEGKDNARTLDRRNQILALMVRNGYIAESVAVRCQREPIRVALRSPIKTNAPAAVGHILADLTLHGGTRFGVEDLFQGRISVDSTVDPRVQEIVNDSLEHGLALFEARHPEAKGLIQGSVVVLANASAEILAEAGGRKVYKDREAHYTDYNRATDSLRQPGSTMKPLVYLAAFGSGMGLDTEVPDEPIDVPAKGGVQWIDNYDNQFKGPISMRQALAESRNAPAVWIAREIGVYSVIQTATQFGIRTPMKPKLSTSLGASEVQLLELANAYRALASGVLATPRVIRAVMEASGSGLYEAPRSQQVMDSTALRSIQEGLRGVVRLPSGSAHSLAASDFPIPVMGKTGTTSDFRDALFVGSTYGSTGITVAVRIGYDDNRPMGKGETGGLAALPIFREIMLRVYQDQLVGEVPHFPREIEDGIDRYLAMPALPVEILTAELPVAPGQAVSQPPVRWSGLGQAPAKPHLDGGRDRGTSGPAIIDAVRRQPLPIEPAPAGQADPEEQPVVSSPPVESEPEAIEPSQQEGAAPTPDATP